MWRLSLLVFSLAVILLGSVQMDPRSWRGSDEGQRAAAMETAADLACFGQDAEGSAIGDRDCCVALHCAPCAGALEPRLLRAGLEPVEANGAALGSARLRGRTVPPEKGPPRLV